MRGFVLVVLVLLLSGCLDWLPERETGARPAETGDGELVATSGFVAHSGAGSVTVVPNGTRPQPASCVLYRNNVSYAADTCAVNAGAPRYQEEVGTAWHIDARWKRSDAGAEDTMARLHEKSIVAFDEKGRAVAEWDGTAKHGSFRMAIE